MRSERARRGNIASPTGSKSDFDARTSMNKRTFLLQLTAALLLPLAAREASAQTASPAAGKIRVACVGDSITYGAGVEKREMNSYPAVLQKLLGESYEVKNFGVSGATLLKSGDKPYWKESAFQSATEFAPNIVVIKLGTNDTKPQNWSHKSEFPGDLRALVDHFAALPSKPNVWLCLPAPVRKANFGINETALAEEMPMTRAVAQEKKTGLIDLFSALKPHPEFFRDGIHPDAGGAKLMAETVHQALIK